jgi:ubiquinone biosynthesis protein UbiJ
LGAGALNRLLRRQGWARERLQLAAGKTLRFAAGRQTWALRVQDDGLTRAAPQDAPADAVFTLEGSFAETLRALRGPNPDQQLTGLMRVEGEAALAQVVMDLAQNLRWDPEDELADIVGDRAALRLTRLSKSLLQGLNQAGRRLGGNVAEYLSEEDAALLARAPFEDWRGDLARLRERLAALDASVTALEQRSPAGRPQAPC